MIFNASWSAQAACTLALFSALGNSSVWGQTITSAIIGQVNDPSGAGIAEARPSAKNAETGISAEALRDSSGAYSIPQLQPGVYDVTVSKRGFVTRAVTGIRVLSSQTVRVDMALDLGDIRTTVTVLSEAPLIHTDTQTISSSFSTRIMGDPRSSCIRSEVVSAQPKIKSYSSLTDSGGSSRARIRFTRSDQQVRIGKQQRWG
jgi:hypothetical protein